MFRLRQPNREIPGIFSYMEFFNRKLLAYGSMIVLPTLIALISTFFNAISSPWYGIIYDILYFCNMFTIFTMILITGSLISLIYSSKAPILREPPKGWAIQLNVVLTFVIGGSTIIGHVLAAIVRNETFKEVFFILGAIVVYILAFVIYFSFTTVGKYGYFILALSQPVVGIIYYSVFTEQLNLAFFIRAIIFFTTCALLFAIPYARGLFQVSNIYKEATGLGGYEFIRAFVLSMTTDGNDDRIEALFNRVGVKSDVKIQYLLIRSEETKLIKGFFIVPHVHFGPFKTCGSSDLPEQIYKKFSNIPGLTVYHGLNDHSENLTNQKMVDKVINRIESDMSWILNNDNVKWEKEVYDFFRDISNSAKVIGLVIDKVPMIFLTRHPLPSDDIQSEIGEELSILAKNKGYHDIMVVDSHNSIIDDEILIRKGTIEANDLTSATNNLLIKHNSDGNKPVKLMYGVAKDKLEKYDVKDGIGYGGMVIHLFKNMETTQKTALIHFDANNCNVKIRSYILNMLQNRGIERGEITTSDSHTVARKFTKRGYSPIGDKVELGYILEKLQHALKKAEEDLEPVEFYYSHSIESNVKIWGDLKYFDVIMATLQQCIKVSQRLLTLSLIAPTFFSLILLLFYYNIPLIP